MSNAIVCIDKKFAVKNSVIDIQLEQCENNNPARKNSFKVAKYDK